MDVALFSLCIAYVLIMHVVRPLVQMIKRRKGEDTKTDPLGALHNKLDMMLEELRASSQRIAVVETQFSNLRDAVQEIRDEVIRLRGRG